MAGEKLPQYVQDKLDNLIAAEQEVRQAFGDLFTEIVVAMKHGVDAQMLKEWAYEAQRAGSDALATRKTLEQHIRKVVEDGGMYVDDKEAVADVIDQILKELSGSSGGKFGRHPKGGGLAVLANAIEDLKQLFRKAGYQI